MSFVNIREGNPFGRSPKPFYGPEGFKVGEVVRLFLAYSTNQNIRIREGKVLDVRKQKRDRLALQLSVSGMGELWRIEPREVEARNADGYLVRGHPHMVSQEQSFKASYLYDCISLAQRLDSQT